MTTSSTSLPNSSSTETFVQLFPRKTDSNGCIICASVPDCPTCEKGFYCVQTIQTCSQCPEVACKARTTTSSSSSKTTIGGITGGVVGLIIISFIVGYLFYRFYFKKKIAFNRVKHHGNKEFFFSEDVEMHFHHNLNADQQEQQFSSADVRGLDKPSTRTSVATTIFTRASNILPIAYIPGVTTASTGKGKNGRALSTYSTASSMNTTGELIGDRYSKASIIGNPMLTTTAIRAQPKLVSTLGTPRDANTPVQQITPNTAINVSQFGGVKTVRLGNNSIQKKKNSGDNAPSRFQLQGDLIEEEEEEEEEENNDNDFIRSGLQSDNDYNPFIIDDEDEDVHSTLSSLKNNKNNNRDSKVLTSNESILLDVEMDDNGHSPLRSPFDDSFQIKQ